MDIRYQPGQALTVNALASREFLEGRIVEFAPGLVIIQTPRPFNLGDPLRIDFDDCMILGEVCACEAAAEGNTVSLRVRDAIPVQSDLARLVSAVMRDGQSSDMDVLSVGDLERVTVRKQL